MPFLNLPNDPIPMQVATQELNNGVMETGSNPRIIEYFKSVGMNETSDRDQAWCGAFMHWCFLKGGLTSVESPSRALSWVKLGNETETPIRGDLVVFARGQDNDKGHVGFVCDIEHDRVQVLAGNQSNAVSVTWLPKDGKTKNGTHYKVVAFRQYSNVP